MDREEPAEPAQGDEALRREVEALRSRVSDLQRALARRREVEDAGALHLAEREGLLLEAERIAHLGTFVWELQSGRLIWSDEMYRILGLDPDQVSPSPDAFYGAVHPADLPRLMARQEESLASGEVSQIEMRMRRPDGSIRHVTVTAVPLYDQAGTLVRLVGGILDRTEALASETTLRRTLGLMEEAQRFAKLGSWRFDPVHNELEWSAEFRRIAGLSAEVEPDTELFLRRLLPEDQARLRQRLEQFQSGNTAPQPGGREVRLRRPDGEEVHARIESFVVKSPDGHDELRGTLLDITDDIRLRRELAQAQKMEAIGRLAGGIAHDFNNLLMVVSANLELLESEVGSRRTLSNSHRALDSAARLTRRLLAFGRKAQLRLKNVDPNRLVEATTGMLHRLLRDDVRIEVSLTAELDEVSVDPIEIERALVNLVVNARDAMPGGGLLRVGTCATELGGAPAVGLWVSDEGPGIAEADLPNIFEPFFTTRETTGGTGLGLATVLGTAEQHGGTVRVESREGAGSTFTVVLPVAEPRAVPDAPEEADKRAAGPGLSSQVLVVDDDAQVASATASLLELCGHAVRVATDPDHALALWRQHGDGIDMVVCDVAMGATRGPDLVARMATLGATPRVLFITGYSDAASEDALGHPVLSKPFSLASLRSAVTAVLGVDAKIPQPTRRR